MRNNTSGFFSSSQARTGRYESKMEPQTGTSCFCLSSAKPIVGECDVATAPRILAMLFPSVVRHYGRVGGDLGGVRAYPAGSIRGARKSQREIETNRGKFR